jgi:hypothetical protein
MVEINFCDYKYTIDLGYIDSSSTEFTIKVQSIINFFVEIDDMIEI